MKKAIALILFVIAGLSACKKDANDTAYDKSYKAWQSFKIESKNSYIYTVSSGSVFGFGSETKITVQNGSVIAREYYAYKLDYTSSTTPPVKTTTEQWQENKTLLGQHHSGAALLTLDQVYQKAKNEWIAVNKKENSIYFEANNNGMISDAGYVPNGCQDDCSVGIRITEIKAL